MRVSQVLVDARAISADAALRAPVVWTGTEPAQRGHQGVDGGEVADYIFSEMTRNTRKSSSDFLRLKRKWSEFSALDPNDLSKAPERARLLYVALDDFRSMVGYGKPWDHKKWIVDKWGKTSIAFGVELEYDIWSNMHYGYVGSMVGIPADLLLDAAGLVQATNSKIPDGWAGRWLVGGGGLLKSLDDPRDQAAIKLGIRLHALYGGGLTREQFISELRNRLGSLITSEQSKSRTSSRSLEKTAPVSIPSKR